MKKLFKESVLLALAALPYIYLALIWTKLPVRVPVHFDLNGVANGWASKSSLLYFPTVLALGINILMLIIPVIDPKKKIQLMGQKYNTLRFIFTAFFSVLAIYILHSGISGNLKNPQFVFVFLGILFAVLGNYFQTVRPNYFIGIRTPWTLENEQVWRKTHQLGGKVWMAGGILIALLSLTVKSHLFSKIFLPGILIMALVPYLYSFIIYQKEKKTENKGLF